MNKFYQVWRLSPTKGQWFRYSHIPDCETAQYAEMLLGSHRAGNYRGNQFKSWMRDDKFKIVHVEQTLTDVETRSQL